MEADEWSVVDVGDFEGVVAGTCVGAGTCSGAGESPARLCSVSRSNSGSGHSRAR